MGYGCGGGSFIYVCKLGDGKDEYHLALFGDNFKIDLGIEYTSKEYGNLEKKAQTAEEEIILKDMTSVCIMEN